MVEVSTDPAVCHSCHKPADKLKKCSQCHRVSYCSQDCQRTDWKQHKLLCKKKAEETEHEKLLKVQTYFAENRQSVNYDDFETIKQLGEGNFTNVSKVEHKLFPGLFFALKICSQSKVQSLHRESDILMEKHALTKVRDAYGSDNNLPTVRLITTFKDPFNLYFLTELLNHKLELWEHVHAFGMINAELARYTFRQICISV